MAASVSANGRSALTAGARLRPPPRAPSRVPARLSTSSSRYRPRRRESERGHQLAPEVRRRVDALERRPDGVIPIEAAIAPLLVSARSSTASGPDRLGMRPRARSGRPAPGLAHGCSPRGRARGVRCALRSLVAVRALDQPLHRRQASSVSPVASANCRFSRIVAQRQEFGQEHVVGGLGRRGREQPPTDPLTDDASVPGQLRQSRRIRRR